uniref:Uncharacterized protein n=1 Tax=Magallana gigas TaxID=29159 RepID=K1PAI7_MAGGI
MELAFLVFGALWYKVLCEELYVTTPTSVLHIDTSTSQTSTIVTKENGRLLGLAADWRGERLYYTDVSPTGGGIYTANLQGGDVRKLPIQYPGKF